MSVVAVDRRLIIPDRLWANVHEYVMRARPGGLGTADRTRPASIWIVTSDGLAQLNHREVVIAVGRYEDEERTRYPEFPLSFLHAVYGHAAVGSTVAPGGRSILKSSAVYGEASVAGFSYTANPDYIRTLRAAGALRGARDPLIAVALFADELNGAERFGQARVLSLLGEQARVHPYPWWFEARRQPVLDLDTHERHSLLARVPLLPAQSVEVILTGAHLDIVVAPEDCPMLHSALADAPGGAALLTRMSHTAIANMFWRPGQHEMRTIWAEPNDGMIPHPPTVGGNFLIVARHGDKPEASIVEDGFGIVLPDSLWRRLISSIESCTPMRWSTMGSGIYEVALRLTEKTFDSPFGERYVTAGEFSTYRPRVRTPDVRTLQNVEIERTVLLNSDDELEGVNVDALVDFIDEASAVVDDGIEGVGGDWNEIVVEFRLTRDEPYFAQLAIDRCAPDSAEVVQRLVERLNLISAPAVPRNELRFQIWLRRSG